MFMVRHCRRAFRQLDENGNGSISAGELERASHLLGYNPTKQEVKEMIEEVDTDGSGQIEFPEFVVMMRERFGALDYQEMCIKEAFQHLDKDGNGHITYDELREVLMEKGEPLTEEEFQKVIDGLDVNHDGKIEYEELARKMCSMDD